MANQRYSGPFYEKTMKTATCKIEGAIVALF
jgi:hypothetical protein